MYPACRGGHIAPGVGWRWEGEAGGRANRSPEGCYRGEDGRVKRAWARRRAARKPRDRGRERRGLWRVRGGSAGRARVMICQGSRSTDDSPTERKTRRGWVASSFQRLLLPLLLPTTTRSPTLRHRLISSFLLFHLIQRQQLQPRNTCAAVPLLRGRIFYSLLAESHQENAHAECDLSEFLYDDNTLYCRHVLFI